LILDGLILQILILVLAISYALLVSLPFSIALFYEKIFKKRAFPYLFVVSGFLFIASFYFFSIDFFSETSSIFLAAGGISLAVASLRLYFVMTGGGWK